MSTPEQANRTADNVLELVQRRRQEALVHQLHAPYHGQGDNGVEYDICCHCEMPWPCATHKIFDGHYIAPPVTEA